MSILPASVFAGYRSGYDGGRNDGLIWQGRGLSTVLGVGARATWKGLSATLAPEFAWQQNRPFLTQPIDTSRGAGRTLFSNPWYPDDLDIPQRFGPDPFATASWGQSAISFETAFLQVGVSAQNLWWGPGIYNALLLTNTAPGFPHVHVSTRRPVDVLIGTAEFTLVAGALRNSGWFRITEPERKRLFTGLAVTLQPDPFPGLYLFGARAFVEEWPASGWSGILGPLFKSPFSHDNVTVNNPNGNSPGSQLISLGARWALPQSGFEAYLEWGREDHAADIKDFLQEPEHSHAYLLGFQKLQPVEAGALRMSVEWAALQHFTPPRPERGTPVWYVHSTASYSNRGQWLGTATGSGGDSQHFRLDMLSNVGWSTGMFLERVKRYEAAFYDVRCCNVLWGHDVELTAGWRGQYDWRDVGFEIESHYSHRYTRLFSRDDNDFGVSVGAHWWP